VRTNVSLESVGALVEGNHENPFGLLGPHPVSHQGREALAVRAYLPGSSQVWVVDPAQKSHRPMRRIHPAGLFEAICPLSDQVNYQLRVVEQSGDITTMNDPYRYEPLLSDYDAYLLGEGNHWNIYNRLGAHIRQIDGVTGVNFAVWAPNASGMSVIGDFNLWDGRRHSMKKHFSSGIWELFIPDLAIGEKYKFRVKNGQDTVDKADPVGFFAEVPPHTASVVTDLDSYVWKDDAWMGQRREANQLDQPISIYEVHLGSWKRNAEAGNGWLGYRELSRQLVEYCQKMGYTHIELMPVSEHPFSGSWGYQPVGLYSITSRHGSPEDFMYFVDHMHENGIGVIIDWVPGHFPRDDHGLRQFDGSSLYEHADPRQGEHPDWGTLIFNYGRKEVSNFLLANALFWLDKYHIDGLRVDAVASMLYLDYSREAGEWIPNRYGGRENLEAIDFLRQFNEQVHFQHPGVLTLAEESTAWGGVSKPTSSGGLGFSIKWNMGWMNDSLQFFQRDPIHRGHHHGELTFSLLYAFSENFMLPFSHDEVVHGKGSLLEQMPGDLWQKFANLRLLYGYMWTHPGKKLLFMGNDIAQWHEWNHDESLQWNLLEWETHQGIQKLVADLNGLYKREPALYEIDFDGHGFEWIDCQSAEDSVLAYVRKAKDPNDFVLVVCNFTPVARENHRVGVPELGHYEEIFNTDSEHYGGTNVGTVLGAQAEKRPWHGRPYSIEISLPPLGVAVFKPHRES